MWGRCSAPAQPPRGAVGPPELENPPRIIHPNPRPPQNQSQNPARCLEGVSKPSWRFWGRGRCRGSSSRAPKPSEGRISWVSIPNPAWNISGRPWDPVPAPSEFPAFPSLSSFPKFPFEAPPDLWPSGDVPRLCPTSPEVTSGWIFPFPTPEFGGQRANPKSREFPALGFQEEQSGDGNVTEETPEGTRDLLEPPGHPSTATGDGGAVTAWPRVATSPPPSLGDLAVTPAGNQTRTSSGVPARYWSPVIFVALALLVLFVTYRRNKDKDLGALVQPHTCDSIPKIPEVTETPLEQPDPPQAPPDSPPGGS
ncbi:nascent polypeptide-associated complex subunit alpha, muscle-specific form-like isoform X2 [Motacilla alba alba]|uniref:nascent polypeptide-associated complex subunit alpha, muscle-specific form-like isoform X2 n=1 Tax=Motacilla alba alba TaxID=1094192 RepID=UPI0018D50302|nr:nascent polypeptide-associated complex subunit alpha, muscle-specific form-like isoform X2 [Motacilla alba alba]